MKTRQERIAAQHDAFALIWAVSRSDSAWLAERDEWYAKRRAAAGDRVRIALACASGALRPSAALKLLNQTME